MNALHVEQSLPICISLAVIGGLLEVAATAVTAIPAVREKEGYPLPQWMRWLTIAGNVFLQTISGFFSALFATWYGPVSIVVPFFYSSTLLCNMLIFGFLLQEKLSKTMKVGTHVILMATILLPIVGPDIIPEQTIISVIQHWYAVAWFCVLVIATLWTGLILIFQAGPSADNYFVTHYSLSERTFVLVVCRAASISIDLTVSRCLVLQPPNDWCIAILIALKLVSGNLYTYAIIVQSYAVKQTQFVPLNATMVILVNALSGILIWDDQPKSWYGYACAFGLLGIGCDLLLTVPLLNSENPEFGNASYIVSTEKKSPHPSTSSNDDDGGEEQAELYNNEQQPLQTVSKQLSYHTTAVGTNDFETPSNYNRPRAQSTSFITEGRTMSRRQAWRETISPSSCNSTGRIRTWSHDEYTRSHQYHLQSPQFTPNTPANNRTILDLSPVRETASGRRRRQDEDDDVEEEEP
jgi:hypothetical protein